MLISVKEALKEKDVIFVDTRSPAEYEEAHIPDAINIPLFDNDERAIVGTLYKKEGKDIAMKKGLDIIGNKLSSMMEQYFELKNKKLILYCWRGGMRSKSIAGLLDSLGFYVRRLEGGHKAFRNYVLKEFKEMDFKPKLIVLYGLTGAGKTELLQKLSPVIDLERLAQHRSSLLGPIGLKPRTQKMFDALLYVKITELQDEKYVFMEGESRKIGKVQMPDFLWNKMKKNSINVKIECSVNNRIKRLVKEYTPMGKEDIEYTHNVLDSLRQKLSSKVVEELKQAIDDEEYDKFTELMLSHYYDPLYSYTVDNVKYNLVVNNDYVDSASKEILAFFHNF